MNRNFQSSKIAISAQLCAAHSLSKSMDEFDIPHYYFLIEFIEALKHLVFVFFMLQFLILSLYYPLGSVNFRFGMHFLGTLSLMIILNILQLRYTLELLSR